MQEWYPVQIPGFTATQVDHTLVGWLSFRRFISAQLEMYVHQDWGLRSKQNSQSWNIAGFLLDFKK